MGLSGRSLSLMVSVVATNGFLLFGYDQGVMSGIISATQFADTIPEVRDNSTWQGFVTAIYEIGCLFGAMFQLAYGDRIGRRRAIILGGVIMILGVVIQISAIKGAGATAQFIVGRTITGIGNGINTSTIPTYQAECSRTTNRGLLICIEGGIIAFGTVIAYWLDFGCSFGSADLTWRFPIAFQVVFGLFLSTMMVFLPESPRWLLTRDRHEEATTVLAALSASTVSMMMSSSKLVSSWKAFGPPDTLEATHLIAHFSHEARLNTSGECYSDLRPNCSSRSEAAMQSSTTYLFSSSPVSAYLDR